MLQCVAVCCSVLQCVAVHYDMVTRDNNCESCHTHAGVMSHIRMSHVTPINESCHTHACVMSHDVQSGAGAIDNR